MLFERVEVVARRDTAEPDQDKPMVADIAEVQETAGLAGAE